MQRLPKEQRHTHTHTHTHAHVQISLNQNKVWNTEFSLKMATYQLHNQCLQTLVRSFSYRIERILNATRYSKMTHSRNTMTPRCLAQKDPPYFKENAASDKCIMLIANLSESNKLVRSKYPSPLSQGKLPLRHCNPRNDASGFLLKRT